MSNIEKNLPFPKEKLSDKVNQLAPSGIRVFFDIVSQRKDIISLGVGEPDFATPQVIIDEAISSLRNGHTYYTSNQGTPELRQAIANDLQSKYNLEYNPDNEILITVGVSEGIDLALRSTLNTGDGVIFGSPSYVSYFPLVNLIGGEAQKIKTTPQDNFRITIDNLNKAVDENSKVLFLNYPANPTGAGYPKNTLDELRNVVLKNDLLVVSDEIYSDLTYDYEHTPFACLPEMKERTILLGGFSKTYAMTGWRVGYAAGPSEWIHAMLKIHQYGMLCAPTISQYAAEAALKYAQKDAQRMKAEYFQRREYVVKEFNKLGLKVSNPEGAFFTFPSIKETGLSSIDFATQLLEKEGVAVIPGSAFGPEGDGYIRAAYAATMDNLKIAMDKIDRFINELKPKS